MLKQKVVRCKANGEKKKRGNTGEIEVLIVLKIAITRKQKGLEARLDTKGKREKELQGWEGGKEGVKLKRI